MSPKPKTVVPSSQATLTRTPWSRRLGLKTQFEAPPPTTRKEFIHGQWVTVKVYVRPEVVVHFDGVDVP